MQNTFFFVYFGHFICINGMFTNSENEIDLSMDQKDSRGLIHNIFRLKTTRNCVKCGKKGHVGGGKGGGGRGIICPLFIILNLQNMFCANLTTDT